MQAQRSSVPARTANRTTNLRQARLIFGANSQLITEEMSVDHVRDRLRVTLPSSLCPSEGSPPADAVVVAVLGSQRHRMWVLKPQCNAAAGARRVGEPERAVYDKSRQNCSWGVQCQMKKLK